MAGKKVGMRAVLLQLRAKEISFSDFERAARKDIKNLASSMFKRWQVPSSLDFEDIVQEMLLAAWQAVEKWDPTLASINGYVVFTMCDKAKKVIHKERAALRRDGGAQSRHAVPMSSLTTDGSLPDFARTLWSEDEGTSVASHAELPYPRERMLGRMALWRLRDDMVKAHPDHERAISALFESKLDKASAARFLLADEDAGVPNLMTSRRLIKEAAALCGLTPR